MSVVVNLGIHYASRLMWGCFSVVLGLLSLFWIFGAFAFVLCQIHFFDLLSDEVFHLIQVCLNLINLVCRVYFVERALSHFAQLRIVDWLRHLIKFSVLLVLLRNDFFDDLSERFIVELLSQIIFISLVNELNLVSQVRNTISFLNCVLLFLRCKCVVPEHPSSVYFLLFLVVRLQSEQIV